MIFLKLNYSVLLFLLEIFKRSYSEPLHTSTHLQADTYATLEVIEAVSPSSKVIM